MKTLKKYGVMKKEGRKEGRTERERKASWLIVV
jgi:hypothetical protein